MLFKYFRQPSASTRKLKFKGAAVAALQLGRVTGSASEKITSIVMFFRSRSFVAVIVVIVVIVVIDVAVIVVATTEN